MRGVTGFANQFAVYGEDIEDVKWFNSAAVGLDRSLIQNATREEWIEQAEYLQNAITDEIISEAFQNLPPETRGESSEGIIRSIKARRDNLVELTKRYYEYFAEIGMITGTDKDDLIEIERLPEEKTRVAIFRLKDGEKADVVSERVYDSKYYSGTLDLRAR